MSGKSKRKSATSIESNVIGTKRVENSWILLVKESLFQNDNFCLITLPHPGSGEPTKYCLDEENRKMYEVITFREPYRSWFIGESVKSDGSLSMVTPVNPIFLVLPRLKQQCVNRAIPLEDLLSEKGFDQMLDFIPSLDAVADMKGSAEMRACKYNEEKTLSWLEQRVQRLAKVLKNKNVHVISGAVSATFVSSNINNDQVDEEFYLKYACGMVSNYLQEDLADLLEKRFNFQPELVQSVGTKRKSEVELQSETKKNKYDNNSENQFEGNIQSIIGEVKKQKPMTAKEKARIKAASGTKTLSAFFTKK